MAATVHVQPGKTFKFQYLKGNCPVCQGQRKDCRENITTNTIHCRAEITTPPGQWGFIGQDRYGFDMWRPNEGDFSYTPPPAQHYTQPTLNVLSNAERDRQFRQIAKHSGLSIKHRKKLEERGLAATTIEQWYQEGWVWSWASDEHIPGTTAELPGIDPNTGRLRSKFWGYTIAIPSVQGHLLGAQIKPNYGGGYFWVSSTTVDGNDQRLDNNETPIGIYGKFNSSLNFVEGYLKAAIAAEQYNLCCVGATGGHWAQSPQQLREIIEATGATSFILNPDGGMLDLKHRSVIEAYNRLRAQLEKWGYRLYIRWWGQTTKADGDIDEISQARFETATIISWSEFLQKLEYDWNAEESFKKLLFSSKQILDETANRVARGFGYQIPKPIVKRKNVQTAGPQAKPISPKTSTSAIVLWQPTKVFYLDVMPGTIPEYNEWIEKGSPQLLCPREFHNPVLIELIQKGYKHILLNGTGGDGKTHRAGDFAQQWPQKRQQIEHSNGAMLHFISPNYRNPDTKTVEKIEEKVSPAALKIDPTKRTPLGHPHRKRHSNKDKAADIPGLCTEDSTIQRLQNKGLVIERGVQSEYCQTICGKAFTCPYLQAKQEQGRPAVIREHLSTVSLTSESEAPGQNGDVLIIDEASRTITPFNKRIDATINDIDSEIGRFAQIHPKLYLTYKPILDAIAQGLKRASAESGGNYGLVHAEVMKFLPSMERLEELFFECNFNDWLSTKDVWEKTFLTLGTLMTMLHRVNNPNNWKDAVEAASQHGLSVSGNALEGWISAQPIYRSYRAIAHGYTDITISQGGLLSYTYRNSQIMSPIREARATIYMDATPNLWTLSRYIKQSPSAIVRLADYRPSYENLTIKVITDLGKTNAGRAVVNKDSSLKRNGPYDIQNRVTTAVKAIAQNPDGLTGLIDYKKFLFTYKDIANLITGYCFNDNRGSNRFKHCNRLISVALATPNLGAKLTEYHLTTGQAYTLKTAPGQFWACQQQTQLDELTQDGFRLRAQHRPTQQLEWIIFADLSKRQMETLKQRFPGCSLEIVPITQICLDAAPKGMQVEHNVVRTLYAQIAAGKNATIDSVAQQVGRSKSRISQIVRAININGFKGVKESLILLFKALKGKAKLSDIPDDLKGIALEYLPAVADALAANEITALEALEQFTTIAECSDGAELEQILSVSPPWVIATFISAFLPLMADGALEWMTRDFRKRLQRMEPSLLCSA